MEPCYLALFSVQGERIGRAEEGNDDLKGSTWQSKE
jgi:hypothetical protein